jgi:diacylglycerol kinase family enzyme
MTTQPPLRIALFNPVAGQRWADGRVQRALALLEREEHVRVVPTRANAVVEQTRALLQDGASEIIACGGDGTVSDIATALEGTEVPLRIIPCGTTNVLAREFGIPVDPIQAVHATAQSTARRPLRTWHIGERRLVVGAGVGWDAGLLHRLSRPWKRALGLGAMVPLGTWLALRYDFPRIHVGGTGADGAPISASGTSLLVCNIGHWGGRNHAFPDVDPGDLLLDVMVLERATVAHLASFWALLMVPGGRPLRLPGVRHLRARTVALTMRPDSPTPRATVHVNGDDAGQLSPGAEPLIIAPAGQLWVRVPESTAPNPLR